MACFFTQGHIAVKSVQLAECWAEPFVISAASNERGSRLKKAGSREGNVVFHQRA